jgi:hypothetical protein
MWGRCLTTNSAGCGIGAGGVAPPYGAGRGLAAAAEEKVRKVVERSASRAVRGRSAMVMTQERGRWVAAVDL